MTRAPPLELSLPVDLDDSVSADGWQAFVEEEGEHGMVLRWFEWDPDVHLQWLAALRDEECCELVNLLVVLDDRSETFCGCVFSEGAEVLSQQVLRNEARAELLSRTASRPAVMAFENSMMFCARICT